MRMYRWLGLLFGMRLRRRNWAQKSCIDMKRLSTQYCRSSTCKTPKKHCRARFTTRYWNSLRLASRLRSGLAILFSYHRVKSLIRLRLDFSSNSSHHRPTITLIPPDAVNCRWHKSKRNCIITSTSLMLRNKSEATVNSIGLNRLQRQQSNSFWLSS